METQKIKHFDLEYLSNLYNKAFELKAKHNLVNEYEKINDVENNIKAKKIDKVNLTSKDLKECYEYINNNVFCLKDGGYGVYEDNKIKIIADEGVFKRTFLNRFPNILRKWFETSPSIIYYSLDCNPKNPPSINPKTKIINTPLEMLAKYKKILKYLKKIKKRLNSY